MCRPNFIIHVLAFGPTSIFSWHYYSYTFNLQSVYFPVSTAAHFLVLILGQCNTYPEVYPHTHTHTHTHTHIHIYIDSTGRVRGMEGDVPRDDIGTGSESPSLVVGWLRVPIGVYIPVYVIWYFGIGGRWCIAWWHWYWHSASRIGCGGSLSVV